MNKQSYICGIINVLGWISIGAGVCIIVPQLTLAMATYYHPDFVPKQWHTFLVYQGFNLIMMLYNIFALRKTMKIYDGACECILYLPTASTPLTVEPVVLTLSTFFAIIITCLARSSPKQSSAFVFTDFTSANGWNNDGVVFLTGLVSPNYMYAGIDGAIHLAEECSNAITAVPRALFSTWIIGFLTAFTFVIAMLYSISDLDAVLTTPTG
jgi:choline transport protein